MCTCGPFMSVIPPGPCPVHEPEKAFWHRLYQMLPVPKVVTTNRIHYNSGCLTGSQSGL